MKMDMALSVSKGTPALASEGRGFTHFATM